MTTASAPKNKLPKTDIVRTPPGFVWVRWHTRRGKFGAALCVPRAECLDVAERLYKDGYCVRIALSFSLAGEPVWEWRATAN